MKSAHIGYVLDQIALKSAHIGYVLNFDICDLQKVGQIKTRVSCHVSVEDVPMIKIWR
jgi:hypothetical protein